MTVSKQQNLQLQNKPCKQFFLDAVEMLTHYVVFENCLARTSYSTRELYAV